MKNAHKVVFVFHYRLQMEVTNRLHLIRLIKHSHSSLKDNEARFILTI